MPQSSSEVEETLKRIQSHRGVEGILIIDNDGVVLKSTMATAETSTYAAEMSRLCAMARGSVRTLDATNDLTFLRVRSRKHEVMIAPGKDFQLIIVQNPNAEA